MYQFTGNLQNLGVSPTTRTYRWHGFGLGLTAGWLPALAVTYFSALRWPWFFLIWAGALPLGFGLGWLFRKK